LMGCLQDDKPVEEKLAHFIQLICQRLNEKPIFRQLFMRELIEQDEDRSRFLANVVMAETCHALHDIFLGINPKCDPHFLTTSLVGLVIFHFQINLMRPYLPGGSTETQSERYLSENILGLMSQALAQPLKQ